MRTFMKITLCAGLLSFVFAQSSFATAPVSGENGKIEWTQLNTINLPSQPVDVSHSLDGRYSFFLTKEREVLVYDQKGSLLGRVPVAKGVSAIDVDPRGQHLFLIDSDKSIAATLAINFIVNIKTADSPYKGKVDAPVTIAVYSDFQ